MKFRISRNSVGDVINYIARDPLGNVRLRESTLKKMEEAITEFNKREEAVRLKKEADRSKKRVNREAEVKKEISAERVVEEKAVKSAVEELPELGEITSIAEIKEGTKPSATKRSGEKGAARREITPRRKFYGYRRGK